MFLRTKVLAEQGAAGTDGGTTAAATANTTAPAASTTTGQVPDVAALTKRLEESEAKIKALNAENAERRVKAKDADEAKAAVEKQKAIDEGRWQDVLKGEKGEREKIAADLAAAQKRLAELEPYEGTVRQRVEAITKSLGDKVPPGIDKLPASQALPILEHIASLSAGPGKASNTTSAHPAPAVNAGDIAAMTADQIRGLTREQRVALSARAFEGGGKRSSGL